jgi:homoserine kinase
VIAVAVAAPWWVAIVTPDFLLETKTARAVLPRESAREEWILEMANTAALVHAFQTGDAALAARALSDVFAEPRRASLIPRFAEVKAAALAAGALGGSISGAGPTVFALAASESVARACVTAMTTAFGASCKLSYAARIATSGARSVSLPPELRGRP